MRVNPRDGMTLQMLTNPCRHLIALLLFALQLLASGTTLAAERAVDAVRITQQATSLTEYFAVLEDPSTALTLSDVQKADVAARFKTDTPTAEALSFGYTRSAYWLRLTLNNTSDKPVERMLEIAYPRLSHIELHQPVASGGYRTLITGNVLPFATRPYKNRNFVFPLILPPQSSAWRSWRKACLPLA